LKGWTLAASEAERRGCCGTFLGAGTEPRRTLGFCRHRSDVPSVAFMSCRRSKRQKHFPGRSFRLIIYNTFSVLGQRPTTHLPRFTIRNWWKSVCVCAHFLAFSRGQESSLRSLPATPHPKDLVTVCGSGAEGPREFVTGSGGHLELCGNRPGRLRNTRPSPFMSQPTRDSDPPRLRSSRTESRAQGFSFWA
jgi:hypothetical protein